MNTRISAANNVAAGLATRSMRTWIPLLAIAAVVIALIGILDRPAAREKAQQLKAEQVDQEDRTLCERLGKAHGNEGFSACAAILSEVRQRNAERFAAEIRGF